ncbi:MAG: citrate synthase [Nanoarchaeota archaeon]|nr:citrate synthase [Nanoarchaeota archaeon]
MSTENCGLKNIVACTSSISTIHDDTLIYRGYSIEDLAEHCSYEEVVYLLLHGELPTREALDSLKEELSQNISLPQRFLDILKHMDQGHPMAKLRTAVSLFGTFDKDPDDLSTLRQKAVRMTAAMGPIVTAISRSEQRKEPMEAVPGRTLAWNFLNMIRDKEPSKEEERLFDTALVLHADHELNASTFTARTVASTNSDFYSSITAAISSLKGPLHGGANEAVMLMLEEIGSIDDVGPYIDDALKNKKKIMGIGHRVYEQGDPRAKVLKGLLAQTRPKQEFRILQRIEKQMLAKKGLLPNVDFYSGLIYKALGLRQRDFTPIFAVSRIAGWSAQLMEQYSKNRLYRPRAKYIGKTGRKVLPLSER